MKLDKLPDKENLHIQSPSGGCVLKHVEAKVYDKSANPVAFRRLCVETLQMVGNHVVGRPSRLQAAVC